MLSCFVADVKDVSWYRTKYSYSSFICEMLSTAKPIQIYLATVQADNGAACCLNPL